MNSRIKAILEHNKPKLPNLSETEMNIYKLGLTVVSRFVGEEFLDLDPLPKDRFSKEGLFFTMPYFDDEQLWCSDNQRILLVIYEVSKKDGRIGSICPLRIDFKMEEKDFKVIVYNQNLPSTLKRNLISYESGQYYTEIDGHDKLKLSELLNVDTKNK